MQPNPSSQRDAAILRDRAIEFFKQRCPKYSRLNLSLRGDSLVVRCRQADLIPSLIRETPLIATKASIAIGISCVSLENNGKIIFAYRRKSKEKQMPLLEEEVIAINNNGAHPELDIPPPPVSKSGRSKGIPLLSVSELSEEFGLDERVVLEALDHENQEFFKSGENKPKMEALVSFCFPDIKAEYVKRALSPIELFDMRSDQGIKESDKEAAQIWVNLAQFPAMARSATERLKKWNPDCIVNENENPISSTSAPVNAPDPTPTPAKRGRKPKPKVENPEEDPTEEKQKRYQIPSAAGEQVAQSVESAIKNNRWKNAAKVVVKALPPDRAEEFLRSAALAEDRYHRFIDNLLSQPLKNAGFSGKRLAEEKESIKSKMTEAFFGMIDEKSQQED